MYKVMLYRLKFALIIIGLAAACQPIQAPSKLRRRGGVWHMRRRLRRLPANWWPAC